MTSAKAVLGAIAGRFFFRISTVITLTGGTMFLMWLGEQITARGVGNGMSILIFTQVVATFPASLWDVQKSQGPWVFGIVLVIGLIIIAAVIFIEQAQRRIPVQYPKRQVGNRMLGGEATHLPLKLNTAGVIPPIFASSLLQFPLTIRSFVPDSVLGVFLNDFFL
jgi:preprotein translocase subunit SecY